MVLYDLPIHPQEYVERDSALIYYENFIQSNETSIRRNGPINMSPNEHQVVPSIDR